MLFGLRPFSPCMEVATQHIVSKCLLDLDICTFLDGGTYLGGLTMNLITQYQLCGLVLVLGLGLGLVL